MSERKTPDDQGRGSGAQPDDESGWIGQLYDEAELAMPPADMDAYILQAAAKKVATPLSIKRRFTGRSRWVSALASAAVLVLTVGVFFRGEVSEQLLPGRAPAAVQLPGAVRAPPADQPPAAGQRPAEGQTREADLEAAAKLKPASAPAPGGAKDFARKKETRLSGKLEAESAPLPLRLEQQSKRNAEALGMGKMQAANEDQPGVSEVLEIVEVQAPASAVPRQTQHDAPMIQLCDAVLEGLCRAEGKLFVVDPQCAQRLALPHDYHDAIMLEGKVIYGDGEILRNAECIAGHWRVEDWAP